MTSAADWHYGWRPTKGRAQDERRHRETQEGLAALIEKGWEVLLKVHATGQSIGKTLVKAE